MRKTLARLYVHLVWATWGRLPLITPDMEPRLYAALGEKCRELQGTPLAIGGVADHVHVLAQVHPTVAIATLVQELKGSTSHLITHAIAPGAPFRWQGAYGAFTLGADDLPAARDYIAAQKEHHARRSLVPEWERIGTETDDAGPDSARR